MPSHLPDENLGPDKKTEPYQKPDPNQKQSPTAAAATASSRPAAASPDDQQAVQTFVLEVDAGHPPQASAPPSAPATSPALQPTYRVDPQQPDFQPSVIQSSVIQSSETSPEKSLPEDLPPPNSLPPVPLISPVEPLPKIACPESPPAPHFPATRSQKSKASPPAAASPIVKSLAAPSGTALPSPPSRRSAAYRSSWWITSLGAHLLLLLVLAFSTLTLLQPEELELYAGPPLEETLIEFQDLEIEPPTDLDALDQQLQEEQAPEELFEEMLEELVPSELSAPAPLELATQGESQPQPAALSNLDSLFDQASSERGEPNPTQAKFFGTEIKARRILYMLDNSGGMNSGGKFEALVAELQQSISQLHRKQKFYVIFYSDTVYPLFYPHSVRQFIAPTRRNCQRLGQWLNTVELCAGNAIDEALAAAEVIQPEAIVLLTDGDLFTTRAKQALLLDASRRRTPIHTFGLGVSPTSRTAANLQQVATANQGTFTIVPISEQTEVLAAQKQRVYHHDRPGPVWGFAVGK